MRTQELEQRGQLRIPSAFPSSGEGSGGGVRPLSRHHVGNRACVAARPERRHPSQPLTCYGGLAGGVSGSLTAMRARFRAFQHGQQSQDMTGSACRFWRGLCVRAGSMLARRVSQVLWSTPPPGSQARVKPKARRAGEAGLDLSKEHLRTQELEQRGQLRIPSAFPSSGEGSGGEEYAPPLSRHHVGNRACVAARPGKKTPQPTPSLVTGISWGVSGSLTAMRARFRAFQHGQQSQDMTGSACRFWRGLCVRAGSMLARRVSQVLWSTPPPGSQARVKPKA